MSHKLLEGKKGLIFGALNSSSIAWKVAERAYEEGAQIILTNTPYSKRLGEIEDLAKICCSEVIYADATNLDDLEILVKTSVEKLGGKLDFILHSIGMSPNVRKDVPYDNTNYEYYLKTLDISALSFHKVLQTCRKLDAISEWGSVVALSYIASTRTLYGYNDMADAKAALESIARSFGYIYGRDKKVRINTISQSPTMTTAGKGVKGMDSLMDFSERMSPLGNATAEECADFTITLFSDLTRKITMQNIYHDGGFSSMGMSQEAMTQYDKSFEECKNCHVVKEHEEELANKH
jgi:enoyl-[acyl-carrier protein] reductase I